MKNCESGKSWPKKMEPIVCPETSALNQPTLRNNTEDGGIQAQLSFHYNTKVNFMLPAPLSV
jgi:hypothetical protein